MSVHKYSKTDSITHFKKHIEKSLHWIDQYLDYFSPFNKGHLDAYGVKVFSELALIYSYIKNNPINDFSQEMDKWNNLFISHLNERKYINSTRSDPSLSFAFILPYLFLRSTGYRSKSYDENYQYIKRWGHYEAIELVPFRQMDVEYFLWKAGLEDEPKWEHLFPFTILGRCKNTLSLNEKAAYSITHTLFYITDFGNQPMPSSLIKPNHLKKILNSLLIHFWRVGHYDLMGELLINLKCLSMDQNQLYKQALKFFLQKKNKDGSMPSSKIRKEKHTDFSFCYHTTLIGILLCAIEINKSHQGEKSYE